MIVSALIRAHRFVLRRELSPFLHQIVARCPLVLRQVVCDMSAMSVA